MRWQDLTYLGTVALAGGAARAARRGLPEGWRIRLEARPPEDLPAGWIWLHAVSVGELILAEGILGWLRERGHRIHVTTGTPAGLALLGKRMASWNRDGAQVTGGAFPLDDPAGLRPFLGPPPAALPSLLWPLRLSRKRPTGSKMWLPLPGTPSISLRNIFFWTAWRILPPEGVSQRQGRSSETCWG